MRTMHSLLVVIALLAATTTFAQSPRTVGIGISINPAALVPESEFPFPFMPIGFTGFYVPINITDNIRVEPEISYFGYSENTTSGTLVDDESTRVLRLGAGAFFVPVRSNGFAPYVGPRFGIISFKTIDKVQGRPPESDITRTQMSWYGSLCGGGEYLLSEHFSLGLEIQLSYISMGEEQRTPDPNPNAPASEQSENLLATNALAFFRMYF